MTSFEVRQCTNTTCQLRIPIELDVYNGSFCPLCGAPMDCVGASYENYQPEKKHQPGTRKIMAVLDNVRSAHNVGAIFRTADGVGVGHLYLCGLTPKPGESSPLAKTALGAEKNVPWSSHLNTSDLLTDLRIQGAYLLVLENTARSVPIDKFALNAIKDSTVVVVVGNERSGLDPGLIALCHSAVHLPMVGEKGSLNVSVAFGAAAYWLTFH
jgi:23S rRNA (guanosine2251-2'-O)-methyltransferase